MKTNWNISWQVARVKAKRMKDVQEKVDFMHDWLFEFNAYDNINRIKNWLRMSIMSASNSNKIIYREALDGWLHEAEHEIYYVLEDVSDETNDFSKEQLQMVLDDLEKRTYTFQYKGKRPKEHVKFVERLEHQLLQ